MESKHRVYTLATVVDQTGKIVDVNAYLYYNKEHQVVTQGDKNGNSRTTIYSSHRKETESIIEAMDFTSLETIKNGPDYTKLVWVLFTTQRP